MSAMPLPLEIIEVPVADRQTPDTLIKQKARFAGLRIEQDSTTGALTTVVALVVQLYAKPLAATAHASSAGASPTTR